MSILRSGLSERVFERGLQTFLNVEGVDCDAHCSSI